jgi:trimeric autotransporter adhesin
MSSQLQVSGEAKIRDIQGPVVANSGVITALDGAASQYVRGDGTLADFPTSSGGGSSVSYYLNSSVSQGTIGGVAYRELSKEPIIGAGTDIAIAANGYVASYLTDANDPDVLSIPGGNFNCEFYFSVSNDTGNPFFYAELYKYDGTTFTLLGSSVGVPEYINQGTIIAPYYFAIPVPTSALAVTDRLAIRIYVNVDGRTVTLHTENSHLCQVVTTLSKGMVSLNNLTDQSQYLTTGTSGTDFTIASTGDTHTFNLPIASATNTGKLSSTDWSTFNNKQPAGNYVTLDTTQTITAEKTFSLDILVNSLTIGRGAGAIASNTAIGSSALPVNTTGTLNTAIGNFSLLTNTTGYGNTSVGHSALAYNTTGFFNAAIGINALLSNTTGTYNNALGTVSLYNNTTGSYNTAVGQAAGTNNTTGSNNTYIGYFSGGGITTGSNNTIIGSVAGLFSSISNNIILADGAGNIRYRYDGTNNNLYGNVNFSSTIGNGSFTYTLPSATGTLALTSNLSAYLLLTGGTLTGALSGTSASFTSGATLATTSGVLAINTTGRPAGVGGGDNGKIWSKQATSGNYGIATIASATDSFTYIGHNGTDALLGTSYGTTGAYTDLVIQTADATRLRISGSTGAATFSSSVGINGGSTNFPLVVKVATNQNLRVSTETHTSVQAVNDAVNAFVTLKVDGSPLLLNTQSGGNVIIGGTTAQNNATNRGNLTINGTTSILNLSISDTNGGYLFHGGTDMLLVNAKNGAQLFYTNDTERMRISSGGDVGIGAASITNIRLYVKGASADSNTQSFNVSNSAGTNLLFVRSDGVIYTGTAALSPYNLTTANSANLFVASDGGLLRSTSSLKYKKNVKNYTKGLAEVMQLRAVTYQGKNDRDNDKQFAGLIAEEVHELGLTEFVQYAEDGTPDALAYQNMIALLVKGMQEQQAQIEELKELIKNK